MKKVKVLFSAFAVIALISGVFAAKSSVNDVVYIESYNYGICDFPVNATMQPNGTPIATYVSLIPSPVGVGHCQFNLIYAPF